MSRMEDEAKREALLAQLEAARTAQAEKLHQSKEHLLGQLRMVGEKYLTVNGYMQAREMIAQATFGEEDPGTFGTDACALALEVSDLACVLAERLECSDVMTLDESLLDGLLAKSFVDTVFSYVDVARQLLIVHLLQNVGPSIDDIVEFRAGTAAGIKTLEDELAKLGGTPGQMKLAEQAQAKQPRKKTGSLKAVK